MTLSRPLSIVEESTLCLIMRKQIPTKRLLSYHAGMHKGAFISGRKTNRYGCLPDYFRLTLAERNRVDRYFFTPEKMRIARSVDISICQNKWLRTNFEEFVLDDNITLQQKQKEYISKYLNNRLNTPPLAEWWFGQGGIVNDIEELENENRDTNPDLVEGVQTIERIRIECLHHDHVTNLAREMHYILN